MAKLIGQRTEIRAVLSTVSTTVGRRSLRGLPREVWALLPTVVDRLWHPSLHGQALLKVSRDMVQGYLAHEKQPCPLGPPYAPWNTNFSLFFFENLLITRPV